MTRRIPPAARLGLLIAASVALALARGGALGALASGTALLAFLRRRSIPGFGTLLLGMALHTPLFLVLFVAAGREATGAWGAGAAWGLERFLPYAARLAGLALANLLLVGSFSLPEILRILERFRVPPEAALCATVLVRFLPESLAEARRILEAQRCRGLGRRRLLGPAGLAALAVPLFLAQARRSADLALSLELRGHLAPRRP